MKEFDKFMKDCISEKLKYNTENASRLEITKSCFFDYKKYFKEVQKEHVIPFIEPLEGWEEFLREKPIEEPIEDELIEEEPIEEPIEEI